MLMSDQALAQAVLDHVEAATTDRGEACWREPVEHYRDPERFDAELAEIRRRPAVLCPSAAVSEPGAYLARDLFGVPLVAIRGADGRVRVFRNACRHRGMEVARGEGCAKAFVCPYHGWTYGADGALRHVPHPEGFPDIDRDQRGLVDVPATERHGLVTVAIDGSSAEPEGFDELAGLLAGLALVTTSEQVEPANWKVITETFLEGLHIRFLHRETFFPVQFDNLNVVEHFGPHSRVTFPFRNVTRLTGVPPERRSLDGRATLVHHLFPTAIIATFPGLRLLFVIDPQTPDRTRVLTHAFAAPRGDQAPSRPGERPGDQQALLDAGGSEDFAAARSVQRGLASGANTTVEFGLYESAIAHFHRHLHRLVDDASDMATQEASRPTSTPVDTITRRP